MDNIFAVLTFAFVVFVMLVIAGFVSQFNPEIGVLSFVAMFVIYYWQKFSAFFRGIFRALFKIIY